MMHGILDELNLELRWSRVMESTPDTEPDDFEPVKGSKAKRNKNTGEIWERDLLHRDHWEVYKTKKKWEQGQRDRAVWNDAGINILGPMPIKRNKDSETGPSGTTVISKKNSED